jgi:hypothetical protein
MKGDRLETMTKGLPKWFRTRRHDSDHESMEGTRLGKNSYTSTSVAPPRTRFASCTFAYAWLTYPSERVFGMPLITSIGHSDATVYLNGQDGRSYVYGCIPIIIDECGDFLKEKGMWQIYSAFESSSQSDDRYRCRGYILNA